MSRMDGKKTHTHSRLRKEGNPPISSGIQPRREDKGKDNECATQRKKNDGEGRGGQQSNQIKMDYRDTRRNIARVNCPKIKQEHTINQIQSWPQDRRN